jgi:hypothetical protein
MCSTFDESKSSDRDLHHLQTPSPSKEKRWNPRRTLPYKQLYSDDYSFYHNEFSHLLYWSEDSDFIEGVIFLLLWQRLHFYLQLWINFDNRLSPYLLERIYLPIWDSLYLIYHAVSSITYTIIAYRSKYLLLVLPILVMSTKSLIDIYRVTTLTNLFEL